MKVGSIQRDEMLNSDFSQILKEGEEKCLKLINRKGFIFWQDSVGYRWILIEMFNSIYHNIVTLSYQFGSYKTLLITSHWIL